MDFFFCVVLFNKDKGILIDSSSFLTFIWYLFIERVSGISARKQSISFTPWKSLQHRELCAFWLQFSFLLTSKVRKTKQMPVTFYICFKVVNWQYQLTTDAW